MSGFVFRGREVSGLTCLYARPVVWWGDSGQVADRVCRVEGMCTGASVVRIWRKSSLERIFIYDIIWFIK